MGLDASPDHPLACGCGTVRGHVALPATTSRAICFCRDCQAAAHWLGPSGRVLDDAGGTGLIAMLPRHVAFTQGQASLACVRLTSKGPLRWYAACCRTPIGNTWVSPTVPYVAVVETCLASRPLEASFGPVVLHLNRSSATRPVASTPLGLLRGMATIAAFALPARLSGRYRENPFFDRATGRPVAPPQQLTPQERAALPPPPASA